MGEIDVRAGSQEPVDFVLKEDTTGDGIPDTGIDLTGITSLEMRLKAKSDGSISSFLNTDPSPQLVVVTAASGIVQFTPGVLDWVFDDIQYEGYFKIIDGPGNVIPVPEGNNFLIIVKEAF